MGNRKDIQGLRRVSAIRCGARCRVHRKSVVAYSTEESRFGGLGYFAEAVSIRGRRNMNDTTTRATSRQSGAEVAAPAAGRASPVNASAPSAAFAADAAARSVVSFDRRLFVLPAADAPCPAAAAAAGVPPPV